MSKEIRITAISRDPIYIGTGGFTIGRVDNTIVRDPITRIPKIPGTSLAGTWRYYMALTIHSYFKEKFKINRKARKSRLEEAGKKEGEEKKIEVLFKNNVKDWVSGFEGNRYAAIKCAGQDDKPNLSVEESKMLSINEDAGHCGNCIVCKTFGFSKQDKSQRGMAYFSDLNILLFPVYTRLGTRWITSKGILNSAGIKLKSVPNFEDYEVLVCDEDDRKQNSINLGWLNFRIKNGESTVDLSNIKKQIGDDSALNLLGEKIIIVSDNIIHQIINSNLETRTSVSIDPTTGAAKEGALFTSEAIPRGTIFYGNVRIEEYPLDEELPLDYVSEALKDSKKYFETLGVGGMTTRGFGRLKIFDWGEKND